jgi:hypothetical protein
MNRLRVLLPVAVVIATAAGCSRSHAPAAVHEQPRPAGPDTVLAEIAPRLEGWLTLWRSGGAAASAASFQRTSEAPFTLHDIRRYDARSREEVRRRRLFGVAAPDSTRLVDPDTQFDAVLDDGAVRLVRGTDAAPALVDLKSHSISMLETSGGSGGCDGAFWLANERFGIVGTGTGGDTAGTRYGYARLYDLDAGTVIEFRTARVDSAAYRRFAEARDSVWTARYRKLPL